MILYIHVHVHVHIWINDIVCTCTYVLINDIVVHVHVHVHVLITDIVCTCTCVHVLITDIVCTCTCTNHWYCMYIYIVQITDIYWMPMYITLQNRSCFTDGHRGGHVPCNTNYISISHIFYLARFHTVEGPDKEGYPSFPPSCQA